MKNKLTLGALLGSAVIVATGMAAFSTAGHAASLQFILTDCNNGAGCTPQTGNNFGTVTITDAGANNVNVNVDLVPLNATTPNSFTWANTGLIGFSFNLVTGFDGANTPTLSLVTANWIPISGFPFTPVPGGTGTDGMGTQQYGLDFTGANNSVTADLNFKLTATGLDVTDFTTGGVAANTGKAYYFLADLCTHPLPGGCSDTGGTGLVGALPVPAPIVGAGLPGVLFACAGLVGFARRRRQMAA